LRIGLRLSGDPTDIAALAILMEVHPAIAAGRWLSWIAQEGSASVLCHPFLSLADATQLAARGLRMVAWAIDDDSLRLSPLSEGAEEERWSEPGRREATSLLEVLRPLRLSGEPQVDEALFVMRPESGEPRRLLERLLLLGRGDVLVCEFELADGSRRFALKVPSPPIYLLMRARDGDGDGEATEADSVTVYARDGKSPLWVEWSYAHPLAAAATAQLVRAEQVALVDREGRWDRSGQSWRTRSIYDALLPEIDAGAQTLTPIEGDQRFAIRIRLAPGPLVDPELWLLSAEEFLELEPLIEAATGDELSRLTVARLTDGSRTHYLLRERIRPGALPLAGRVSETLGVRGFARVAGADNLYLPSDRRLVPMLRRDDLRALLGLDSAHLVLVTEDRDGPQVITVPEVDEAPLQRWIDYVATDRRLALDQLLERSVFDFPDVTIVWPEVERRAPSRPPPRERKATRPKAPVPIALDVAEEVSSIPEADEGARLRALRAEARSVERTLAVGGVDEPELWERLGHLKIELDEADEGVACLEIALFHGGLPYDVSLAAKLRQAHVELAHRTPNPELLMELLVADRRTPAETSALAALLIERLAAGSPPSDEVMQLALPVFSDPRQPIPRRLAWSVLAAWHRHAGDRLGLTRAKEAILGGVNERGLSELHDLPRFVRYALTLSEEDESEDDVVQASDRLRLGQLTALEELWRAAENKGLPELDAHANFVRLIFGVGFARLGARASAMQLIAPVEEEIDVHEVPNRALFRFYMARLAHESSGGSDESWAVEAGKQLDAIRRRDARKAVTWLQKRSLWLRGDPEQARRKRIAPRYVLPVELELDALGDRLRREMAPQSGNFDYTIAQAVDVCLKRALASGSEALVAEIVAVVEPNLDGIVILGHRAEAIGSCITAVASLGDDAGLGRLLERLVELAEDPHLGSVAQLIAAVRQGISALRRFGGIEPARGLLEALSGVKAYTSSGTIELLSTIASGLVQLGEERAAGALLDRLIAGIFDGSFDYVNRCEAGIAVAGALRHWPNIMRVERCRRFVEEIDVFRDTFTTSRYFETHKIRILEAVVDSLADAETRHSDRVQGYLDLEEHALRRRIIADWSALCGH